MKKLKTTYIALGFVLMYTPCLLGGGENISNNKISAAPDKLQTNLSNDIERPLLRPIQVKIEEKPVASEPKEQAPELFEMEVQEPEVVAAPPSQPQPKPQIQQQPRLLSQPQPKPQVKLQPQPQPRSQPQPLLEPKLQPQPQLLSQPSALPDKQTQDELSEEAILSILKAEKEKLQALEKKYGQLADEFKLEEGYEEKGLSAQTTVLNNKPTPANDTSSAKNALLSRTEGKPAKGISTNAGNRAVGQQKAPSEESLDSRLEKEMKTVNSFNAAECYYKLCEYENALKTYKMITPDNCLAEQYQWAQFQIANCYRNLKDFEAALGEFKRFTGLSHDNELIDQANWYISDIQWWKTWNEKKSLVNNQLLAASGNKESK
ncbi:MAG: Tetratricopeptide repeat protein [Candidatus Brocadiaceae bacterium]|nr:Tetratricopeptide repeat protein [Candidatus Brocadiaceae bacterium]